MNYPLSSRVRTAIGCSLVFASAVFLAIEVRAQDVRLPLVSAPPPMKFVPRNERSQLSATRDAKSRTRAAIELAELRLARAEELTGMQQYDGASAELGVYQGLIEDALYSLNETKKVNKQRDIYKRLELSLRSHCARIEAIRRVTPNEYAVNIKAICECARKVRTEALNGFYGDTVVRQDSLDDPSPAHNEVRNEAVPATLKKQ